KPFFSKHFYLGYRYLARDHQYRIGRHVVPVKEILDLVKCSVSNMTHVLSDSRPLVGMHIIYQRPQLQPNIAVRLIEIVLFEFFDNDLALHFENFGIKRKTQHPIAFERSEEHTSELQSRENLVCRLLLEKKKKKRNTTQLQNQ